MPLKPTNLDIWPASGVCPICKRQTTSLRSHYSSIHRLICKVRYASDPKIQVKIVRDSRDNLFHCLGCVYKHASPRSLQRHAASCTFVILPLRIRLPGLRRPAAEKNSEEEIQFLYIRKPSDSQVDDFEMHEVDGMLKTEPTDSDTLDEMNQQPEMDVDVEDEMHADTEGGSSRQKTMYEEEEEIYSGPGPNQECQIVSQGSPERQSSASQYHDSKSPPPPATLSLPSASSNHKTLSPVTDTPQQTDQTNPCEACTSSDRVIVDTEALHVSGDDLPSDQICASTDRECDTVRNESSHVQQPTPPLSSPALSPADYMRATPSVLKTVDPSTGSRSSIQSRRSLAFSPISRTPSLIIGRSSRGTEQPSFADRLPSATAAASGSGPHVSSIPRSLSYCSISSDISIKVETSQPSPAQSFVAGLSSSPGVSFLADILSGLGFDTDVLLDALSCTEDEWCKVKAEVLRRGRFADWCILSLGLQSRSEQLARFSLDVDEDELGKKCDGAASFIKGLSTSDRHAYLSTALSDLGFDREDLLDALCRLKEDVEWITIKDKIYENGGQFGFADWVLVKWGLRRRLGRLNRSRARG
ncbi:hypothetical protein BKA93DRAFT_785685 [Sparassis latifolia]